MVGPVILASSMDDGLVRSSRHVQFGVGAYRGKGVGERLACIIAGGFFSPHLGLFALAAWLWWVVPMGIPKAKDYIWQWIVALFCCSNCRDNMNVEQGQPGAP
jgi:hypothetical protein